MQLTVKNIDNQDVGTIEVDDAVFGLPTRRDILARVVDWQLAKRRAGTHKVKERGEGSMTTAKMYKQKGTGRARHGARSVNIFRGGGVVHGPRVRDHGYDLPKKVRKLGLKTALSSKQTDGKLIVVDALSLAAPKTKELRGRLQGLGLEKVLIIDGPELDAGFKKAAANLPHVRVLASPGANVYDILRFDTLVLTRAAVQQLEARLK